MMTGNNSSFLPNPDGLDMLRKELVRRKIILTSLAEDSSKKMDESDREHILKYLRDGYLPEHPKNIPFLMKEFASSGSSYSVTRNYLKTFIGKFPGPENIAEALSQAFGEDGFLEDDNWYPASLNSLVDSICDKRNWANENIGTKVPDSRILGLLKDGAGWFEKELADGLNAYYKRIESRMTSPELAWDYVTEFSSPIRQFGEALASDYLKNIGFHQYVKPDFHFLREFPQLAGLPEKMKSRDQFIVAWHLSKSLGITAFYLDHLLYEWGRYGNSNCLFNKNMQSVNFIFQEKDLQKMKEKTDVKPFPGNPQGEVSSKTKDAKQSSDLKEAFESICSNITINTGSMKKKAEHLRRILQHYNGRIPLTMMVSFEKRKEACHSLFRKDNEFNYILYTVWMGLKGIGALAYDGDYIILKYPEKLS